MASAAAGRGGGHGKQAVLSGLTGKDIWDRELALSIGMEALFTTALGLQAPWEVSDFNLDVAARRIDFEVDCKADSLDCPVCGAKAQGIHSRVRRSWRHLDFFQYEAWVHAEVPRVKCRSCGKTTRVPVPWARPGGCVR